MFRVFIIFLLVLLSNSIRGQVTFDQRLIEIERLLNEKSLEEIPSLLEVAQFAVDDTPIQELIRSVAEAHNLNVSISPQINEIVTNNFKGVKVKDLIFFLCRNYHLNLEFYNNILSFTMFIDPPKFQEVQKRKMPLIRYEINGDLLTMDLENDSLSLVVRELSRISGKNVLVGPLVSEKLMKGYLSNVLFRDGLEKLAFANGLALNVDSTNRFFILNEFKASDVAQDEKTKASNKVSALKQKLSDENLVVKRVGLQSLNIEAVNVPIADVIKAAALEANIDFVFISQPEGNINIRVRNSSFKDLLDILLKGTEHTYVTQESTYIIGSRLEEGFRKTRLIKFVYRTAFQIEKSIPEPLRKNVQIIPFEELNALILSGSENRLAEVESFLKSIDQPVPNIMIDVVVIDVRKNHSVQTGIKATLGDSIVKTQGQLFPGMDMTIGANTINSLLDKLEATSPINLGKVKPNFYLQLQAMEQNGDLKIKSTPKLSTLNGHEAVLTIGKSEYFEERTQNIIGGISSTVTVTPHYSKVEANMNIKIKPMVSGNENVTLDIEAEFSDFIPSKSAAPPGNSTRRFASIIRIKNEEMVLLGGLEETSKQSSGTGVPLLSRIPILKWLFSSRSRSASEGRLLVLIKPTIIY